MALKIETILMGPDTDQYAGKGNQPAGLSYMAETVKWIEQMGFDGITSPEAGHDPYLPLMIAAEHTNRINLTTNVAISFPRSPMVTAQLAWDLQRYSGGRFSLGLGTQVKSHNTRRYSTPWPSGPGPRQHEYIQCLQAIFKSFQNPEKPVFFEGEFYQFTMLPPFFNPGPNETPHVPISVAAVGPYMARTAGELCDGLRLHPIATFAYTKDVILSAIEEGAKKSGRTRADINLIGAPFLAVGKDMEEVEKATNDLRQQISFYASTPSYRSVLEYHGWEDIGIELHKLSLEGKWADMPRLISDDMLEEWAVIATYDTLAEKAKAVSNGLFDTLGLNLKEDACADEDWLKDTLKTLQS